MKGFLCHMDDVLLLGKTVVEHNARLDAGATLDQHNRS